MDETWYGEVTELDLNPAFGWVYRLWDINGRCLYVGQTKEPQPWARVKVHRMQPWWPEVNNADYVQVPDARHLNAVERHFAEVLKPKYNDKPSTPVARRAARYARNRFRDPLLIQEANRIKRIEEDRRRRKGI